MSTKAQKEKIAQVAAVIGQTDSYCKDLLTEYGWDVESATDAHFSRGTAPRSSGSSSSSSSSGAGARSAGAGGSAIDGEFKRFQSAEAPGTMDLDGIESFAGELGIDPFSDPLMLLILQSMGCKEQSVIKQEEWTAGFAKLGVTTVAQLKAKLPALRERLASNAGDTWTSLWQWSYEFSCEPGQKSVTLDMASGLSQLLLDETRWPLATAWQAFLTTQKKTVTKDTWKQLGARYIPTVRSFDFVGHEDDGSIAWPSQLDDFKEYCKSTIAKKGVGAFKMTLEGAAAGAGSA